MTLSQGQILNSRYRIVRLLKVGGFGAVYRAWDLNLQRPCAVKENNQTSADSTRQFLKEATILANLSHQNLPRVTDHFIIPNQGQYLVMDYIEGQDLSSMLNVAGHPLPVETIMPWITQVSDALSYMHTQTQPIIHRDIKPENIKITPDGRAVLVDFGISKVYEPNAPTTSGARAVTPGYSPPEQYGRGATDIRSDIYAFGATIYTLLTNLVPADSVDILRDPAQRPIPISQVNHSVSPQISAVVDKAMQIDPRERFANLSEMKLAFANPDYIHLKETVVARPAGVNYANQPVPPIPVNLNPPIATKPKSPTWIWLLLAGIFVIAIIAGSIFVINNNTAEPTSAPVVTDEPPADKGGGEIPAPPGIQYFELSRTAITRGECLELRWGIIGDLSEVQINRDNLLIHSSSSYSAAIEDCPTTVGGVLYSLIATGPGGSKTQERQLIVEDIPATEPPVVPDAPQIVTFDLANSVLEPGGCTEVFWEIAGALSESSLYRNNDLIDRRSNSQGRVVECPSQPGQYIYRLEAQGPGGSTQNERSLQVKPQEPTSPPSNSNVIQPVAYTVGDPGASDIYLYYPESNTSQAFVKALCDSSDPEWSSDGRSILYQSNCPDKINYDLFILDVNGGIPFNLTNTPGIDEREPHYSADGQQIVFQQQTQNSGVTNRNNEGEIFIMNRDGSGRRSLGLKGRQPVISPNGQMLAFMAKVDGIWQIYVHTFSSDVTRQLTTNDSTNSRFPTWSPDSRYIVYSTSIDRIDLDPNGIYKYALDGSSPIGLIQNEQCGRPDWSESGWIVYQCAPGIEMMREDGSNRTMLVNDQRAFAPVWLR